MAFYDLSTTDRASLTEEIRRTIHSELGKGVLENTKSYFSDPDTYIRKSAYIAVGRIYLADTSIQKTTVLALKALYREDDFRIRQTVVNAAGEIGRKDFGIVQEFFDTGLFDTHHSVRNAVIGSVKKMGEVNPKPVLAWAREYLHHPDKEIRREICHGIELRGRKHPLDILPLLKELQFDKTARVRNTLVHVIGQISYKKGCLTLVAEELKNWDNKELVENAISEILVIHKRYKNFATHTTEEAGTYLRSIGYHI